MGERTGIEWTDATFNPWLGCTRVSPACDHCYAERLATTRLGVGWGPHAARKRTAASTWRLPLTWDRKAERDGVRRRVFCASLADVFDNQVDPAWRSDLWDLIASTPHLDWLLLTKRPQNIAGMLPVMDSRQPGYRPWNTRWPWPNVWLGTTVENQREAERRIPHLLAVPARLRFLSCEPLLGPLDLTCIAARNDDCAYQLDALRGEHRLPGCGSISSQTFSGKPRIHWIIAGGESGPGARPSHPDWFRSLRDQCKRAGLPFFFKQWGEWGPVVAGDAGDHISIACDDGGDETRLPSERRYRLSYSFPDQTMALIGKRLAGALLFGREHRAIPHA